MKTYEYRGFDASGKGCRGLVEALDTKEAREKLAGRGILAERVTPARGRKRIGAEARSLLYHELASLLGAGLPLVRSLDILIDSPELEHAAPLLGAVRDRVKEGAALADALAAECDTVTAFESSLLQAAERSATVSSALAELGRLIEQDEKLRSRVRGALIYPAIVFAVGVCVAAAMLGLLLPRAQDILVQAQGSMPALTSAMVMVGRFTMRWGAVVAVAVVVLALWHRARLRRDAAYAEYMDRKSFRVPLLGGGYELLVNLRFARTLAILLRSGVGVVEGLAMAGRATGSCWLARLAGEGAESVRHGESLAKALRKMGPLGVSLPGWVRVGEASGELAPLLERAALRYEDRWERYTQRSLSFLEPILILLIGGFVLLVTLSVLLPVLSLSRTLG